MRETSRIVTMLAALLLAACGGPEDTPDKAAGENTGNGVRRPAVYSVPAPSEWPSAEERRLKPDHAPTPYTVAMIREGCRNGRTALFRFQMYGKESFQRFRIQAAVHTGP